MKFSLIFTGLVFLCSCASQTHSPDAGGLKTYVNDQIGMTMEYPASWSEQSVPTDNAPYRTERLFGSEGSIDVTWGSGLGGACGENGTEKPLEKLMIGDRSMDVCHTRENGGEAWRLISWTVSSETGVTVDATALAPAASNSPVILQILSTLKIGK